MSILEGFERYTPPSPQSRPPKGHMRVSISSGQITFSEELVVALGLPKTIDLFQDQVGKRIAIKAAGRDGLRFVGEGSRGQKEHENAKVVVKNPAVLSLFQAYVDPLKSGTYYCVDAEVIDEKNEKIAIFDMKEAVKYEVNEKTLASLKNSKKQETA